MRRPNLPKGRPGVPRRRVRVVQAIPTTMGTFFGAVASVVKPLTVVAPIWGPMPDDVVAQAERGRIIGMMDQQIRTIERENQQANYANGWIPGPGNGQYF